jgi:hypothetical protein
MNRPGDPNQGGYPPQGGGYPPQGGGYPPQPGPGGYPPNQPYPPRQGGSNTTLLITLIVLVVALIAGGAILYFTGAFGGSSSTSRPNVAVSTPAPVTPTPMTTPRSTPPVATGGGDVATLLQAGVAQMQPQIPIRNGPATITAVSAVGTVLTMEMEINQPVSPAEWDQLQGSFQQNICAGQFRNAISMGASAQVEVTDSVGSSRTYNISSC